MTVSNELINQLLALYQKDVRRRALAQPHLIDHGAVMEEAKAGLVPKR